jgi:hypothetical protein
MMNKEVYNLCQREYVITLHVGEDDKSTPGEKV